MTEVVGAFGQGGSGFGRGEGGLPGLLPDSAVDAVGEQVAAFALEEAAVGRGAVFGDVAFEEAGEGW